MKECSCSRARRAAAQLTPSKREALIQVSGKQADAALGRFALGGDEPRFIAVVEGKGPRDPLDRPFVGRALSAVDQALRYAVNLQCDWYLVMSLREIRVYHKGHDQFTYEGFETAGLVEHDRALVVARTSNSFLLSIEWRDSCSRNRYDRSTERSCFPC
jgi:hypothetical protein